MPGEISANWVAYLGPTATIASAFVGFLGGTIINDFLARRRSDRERWDREIDFCQGLIGELLVNGNFVSEAAERIRKGLYEPNYIASLNQPLTAYYESTRGQLGFLGWELSSEVHSHYASLQALAAHHRREGTSPFDPDPMFAKEMEEWTREHWLLRDSLMSYQRPLLRRRDRKAWDAVDRANKKYRAKQQKTKST